MTARKKASRKKAARRRTPKKGARKKQAARPHVKGSPRAARIARAGGGKPRVEFDLEKLQDMAQMGMSQRHMAVLLDVSPTTLQARIADTPEVARAIELGTAQMHRSIRVAQLRSAVEDRNPTSLVWLGKVVLGQQETVAFGGGDDEGMDLTAVLTLKIDELIKRGARERKRAAEGGPSGG